MEASPRFDREVRDLVPDGVDPESVVRLRRVIRARAGQSPRARNR